MSGSTAGAHHCWQANMLPQTGLLWFMLLPKFVLNCISYLEPDKGQSSLRLGCLEGEVADRQAGLTN